MEASSGISPIAGRGEVLAKKLARFLAHNDIDQAKRTFERIAKSPADLAAQFERLQKLFTAAGHGDLLLDLLLAEPPKTLRHLRVIAKAIELGQATGREAAVKETVSGIL